jgi:regulatory protein
VPSKKIGNRAILSISLNKKGKHVVTFGDGKLVLSDAAFTEIPLYVGKDLTSLEYHELANFAKIESLLAYGLSLASKGCYSSHEIRERLLKKCQREDPARQVMFRLRQEGFLDDSEFARQFQSEKENQLYGQERILQALRFEKGVKEEIVSSLHFTHEEEHATKAAREMERKYSRFPLAAKKKKAIEALRRRGFAPSVAFRAVEDFQEDRTQSLKTLRNLAEKAVKRYGKKYNGYDLRGKAFAYLLSKGFESDDVSRVLEDLL